MNQELNKYFKAAKSLNNFKEPLDRNEYNTILSNENNGIIKSNNVKLIGVIVMLTISAIIVFFSLFQFSEINQETVSKTENADLQKQESTSSKSIEIPNKSKLEVIKIDKKGIENYENEITTTEISLVNNSNSNEVTNPNRKEKWKELIRSTSIGIQGTPVDFLEPGSLENNAKGYPIPGLLTLKLTETELENLGINNENSKLSYPIEYYHFLHPIPMRNNNIYRLDPQNSSVFEKNYPVNGDTFLVKTRHIIELDRKLDKTILLESSMPAGAYNDVRVYDTINGKVRRNLKLVVTMSSNKDYIGKDYHDVYSDWKKRALQGFDIDISQYTGWNKNSYSMTCPIVAAFKYNGIKHKYVYIPHISPIKLYHIDDFDYSSLIPIEINFSKDKLIEKLILWYYPTPQFIEALPERYRNALRKELNVISSIKSGALPINEACKLIAEESFFDLCRFSNGAIEFNNVYPNPTYNGNVTLSFKTSEQRNIEINAYDIQGNFLGRISVLKNLEKGSHNIKMDLTKLTTGLYIIGILSDKNEFVSQRLVIN